MKYDQISGRKMDDGKSEEIGGREETGRMRVQLDPSTVLSDDPHPWLAAFPVPVALSLPLSPLPSPFCLLFTVIDFRDELRSNAVFKRFYFYLHVLSH